MVHYWDVYVDFDISVTCERKKIYKVKVSQKYRLSPITRKSQKLLLIAYIVSHLRSTCIIILAISTYDAYASCKV